MKLNEKIIYCPKENRLTLIFHIICSPLLFLLHIYFLMVIGTKKGLPLYGKIMVQVQGKAAAVTCHHSETTGHGGTGVKWRVYAPPKGGIHSSLHKQLEHGEAEQHLQTFFNFNMLVQTLLKPNQTCLWTACLQLLVSVSVFLWALPQVTTMHYKVIWCTRTSNDACLYLWFTSQSNSAEHLQCFIKGGKWATSSFIPNTQDPVSSLEGNINLYGDKKL